MQRSCPRKLFPFKVGITIFVNPSIIINKKAGNKSSLGKIIQLFVDKILDTFVL